MEQVLIFCMVIIIFQQFCNKELRKDDCIFFWMNRWVKYGALSPYMYIRCYCITHNVSVCLYLAYIACGSTSLYIKTLYFFLTALALSAVATVANIKIRYDAKAPQFALFGTRVIWVFYSKWILND